MASDRISRDLRPVHRLAPEDVVRVLDGDREDHLETLGEEAVAAGLRTLERDRVGRRALVTNGAIVASTGIFTLWLPGSASAASLDVAAEGTGFDASGLWTANDGNGGSLRTGVEGNLGFIPIENYTGTLLQIVVEASAGGRASNSIHEPGRGRRIAANFDLVALQQVTDSLFITYSNNYSGMTSAEGGGDGGQAIAVTTGSPGNVIVVMAGAGGGAGLDSAGGDADAAGASYTNPAGGVLSGGAPGSGGTGGASGTQTGTWALGPSTFDPGQDYPGGGEAGVPAGVVPWNLAHGSGGGGYGSGGFGGRTAETVGQSNVVRSTGGGGGGSFVNTAYRVGFVLSGYSSRSITQRCRVTWYHD